MYAVQASLTALLVLAACTQSDGDAWADTGRAPPIKEPACNHPAELRDWTPGAQAFYFEYKSRMHANIARTAALARELGFEVLGSSEGSFTVLSLRPSAVAAIRCMPDISLAAYVIPPPIAVGFAPDAPL
jgi:hypothetical protein